MATNEPTYDVDALKRGIIAMEADVDRLRDGIKEIEKRIDNYRFHMREALRAETLKHGNKN